MLVNGNWIFVFIRSNGLRRVWNKKFSLDFVISMFENKSELKVLRILNFVRCVRFVHRASQFSQTSKASQALVRMNGNGKLNWFEQLEFLFFFCFYCVVVVVVVYQWMEWVIFLVRPLTITIANVAMSTNTVMWETRKRNRHPLKTFYLTHRPCCASQR